jgi:UDP-N-acetylmuramoyl-L-alanyl-D-glutamate--2,6-diaminopimelate ligase
VLLQDILYKVAIRTVRGSTSVEVNGVALDSRKVEKGSLFVAVKGSVADGHLFIEQAVANGAAVVVCEQLPALLNEQVVYVEVANSASAAGQMAHNFFDKPSEKLKLTGVTGTNGKTTIATLLYKLFTSLGYTCGLISTVENLIADKVIAATHTTPDAVSLNNLLKQMVDEGCTHVFMETSSHALHQHRVTGLRYAGGIFSNITHDHLDYHKSFDEYIRVKKSFLIHCLLQLLQSVMLMIKEDK